MKSLSNQDLCHLSGSPQGYSYILVDEGAEEVIETGEVDTERLEVTGTLAYKKYTILIAAKSELGKGPYALKSITSKTDAWHSKYSHKFVCGMPLALSLRLYY